jgi:hypothetical protein
VLTAAAALSTTVSRTAVTPPRPDKWRDEHPQEIASVTAMLEPMMARLGYV